MVIISGCKHMEDWMGLQSKYYADCVVRGLMVMDQAAVLEAVGQQIALPASITAGICTLHIEVDGTWTFDNNAKWLGHSGAKITSDCGCS